MSSYDILMRPYLPSSLNAVSGMADSILTASSWYGVSTGAIAGALALEQNNAEQFSFKYAFGNFAVGDSFGETHFSSDDIYGIYKSAQANGTAQNPGLLDKFFNQVNFDTGPARIRIALAISLKRLFHNTTTEWIKLTWLENGEAKELVATPGHHMLDKFGAFTRLDLLVHSDKAEVVLASGAVVEAKAEHITYSAETASLFEQAASDPQSAASGAVGLMH